MIMEKMKIKLECPRYNPETDLGEVEPGLAIDITEAFQTGMLRGAAQDLSYENTLKDPSEVGSYVRDPLDALQVAKELKESIAAARKSKASNSNAVNTGNAAPTGGEQA